VDQEPERRAIGVAVIEENAFGWATVLAESGELGRTHLWVDDRDWTAIMPGQPAAMPAPLQLVAEGGEHGTPVGPPAKCPSGFLGALPPQWIAAEAMVEGVQGEQAAQLEAGDTGLVEPVELSGELADRLQAGTAGKPLEHLMQRADLHRPERAVGVQDTQRQHRTGPGRLAAEEE